MAQITTFPVGVAGGKPTFRAAAAADTAAVGGDFVLIVKNGDASPHTVTIAYPGNLASGDPITDKVYTVAAAGEEWVPLLSVYADPADALAHISYDATTSVTVAVIKV